MSNEELDLNILFQEISSIISRNIYNVTGEKKKQLLNKAENYISEAEEIVNKMKKEASKENNIELDNKIKNAQNNIAKYKSLLAQEKTNQNVNERTQLLGNDSETFDYNISDMDQRTRLLYGTQRLQDMNSRFENTLRISEEAEQAGINTLQMLLQQRQQILRTNDTLNQTHEEVGRSGRLLSQIQKSEKVMRLLLILLIVIILIIVAAAIYFKITKIIK
ncbi:hypothetical protein H8356DRAFT_1423236 [Neocallimastix lanati (nom. inval.)]|uniref:Uncharacterized protein n=1 Tax=Neocallimastix californiae TaxID=1754190 RepID=A0A1Y2ETM6_9FUNG|nr:hypothetical protein H8356DRAFT_1423236 [Neocallimastix sp. JGI-2020a]ORY74920.1 hypothetical protein LY90DRAFT_699144 [Neocallimastix californiae]|eukprot:ORY74920.1 hypothetical protein LY90DRAFT_699144 [Neocallimastix californiae]